ncbi:hypothetical protein GOP47_0022680 [Adiantum capillus-veneris]|uniref:GDSL esterase/lipase n=1 Tax=Adiantum capillus-veneris TaxID=13818 RepID=A0A9D4Z730_ADICA|nr:hypothetical protein GOP47_0022680 [Adiantum capillus-veneris]
MSCHYHLLYLKSPPAAPTPQRQKQHHQPQQLLDLSSTASPPGSKGFYVPALIIFGDSTVDVGMNNNLTSIVKSNFLPYGENFLGGNHPTGRFCNGQLAVDAVATFLELPFPLAYFDPQATGHNVVQGINFASSASGYNDNTAKFWNVISLTKQLEFFKSYKAQLAEIVGSSKASNILSEALYILSTGSNDYANNYFYNLRLKAKLNIKDYTTFLVQSAAKFIEELYLSGVRKLAIVNVPPLGCLPFQRTVLGARKLDFKDCLPVANEAAASFNQGLDTVVKSLREKYTDYGVVIVDCYTPLLDIYTNPAPYGIEVVKRGCCSTGRLETAIFCNRLEGPLSCKDPSKFMFWDSYHPTEVVYKVLADKFIQIVVDAKIL